MFQRKRGESACPTARGPCAARFERAIERSALHGESQAVGGGRALAMQTQLAERHIFVSDFVQAQCQRRRADARRIDVDIAIHARRTPLAEQQLGAVQLRTQHWYSQRASHLATRVQTPAKTRQQHRQLARVHAEISAQGRRELNIGTQHIAAEFDAQLAHCAVRLRVFEFTLCTQRLPTPAPTDMFQRHTALPGRALATPMTATQPRKGTREVGVQISEIKRGEIEGHTRAECVLPLHAAVRAQASGEHATVQLRKLKSRRAQATAPLCGDDPHAAIHRAPITTHK